MKITKNIIIILILVGLAVSVYLTKLHYAQDLNSTPAMCGISEVFSNCNSVLQSKYSEFFGIPTAVLGVLFYVTALVIVITSLLKQDRIFIKLLFWLELVGVIFSVILTYLQFFVLRAVCPYCLTSAIVTILVFGFSFYLKIKR